MSSILSITSAIDSSLAKFCKAGTFFIGEVWTPETPATKGTQYFSSRTSKRYAVSFKGGASTRDLKEFQVLSECFRFKAGRGLVGRVMEKKVAEYHRNVTNAETATCPRASLASNVGAAGCFGFPVLFDQSVVAVVVLFSSEELNRVDIQLLQKFKSILIENMESAKIDAAEMKKVDIPTTVVKNEPPEDAAEQGSIHHDVLPFESIARHFNVPIDDAARVIGLCTTLIKRMCREHGIERWPFRKLDGINKSIAALEAILGHSGKTQAQRVFDKILVLKVSRLYIVSNRDVLHPKETILDDDAEDISSKSDAASQDKESGKDGEEGKKRKGDDRRKRKMANLLKSTSLTEIEVSNEEVQSNKKRKTEAESPMPRNVGVVMPMGGDMSTASQAMPSAFIPSNGMAMGGMHPMFYPMAPMYIPNQPNQPTMMNYGMMFAQPQAQAQPPQQTQGQVSQQHLPGTIAYMNPYGPMM